MSDFDFNDEINSIKTISEKIKYSVKYKDHFESKYYYYIILSFYDDNLLNFFENNKKGLPPNLIKKNFHAIKYSF